MSPARSSARAISRQSPAIKQTEMNRIVHESQSLSMYTPHSSRDFSGEIYSRVSGGLFPSKFDEKSKPSSPSMLDKVSKTCKPDSEGFFVLCDSTIVRFASSR